MMLEYVGVLSSSMLVVLTPTLVPADPAIDQDRDYQSFCHHPLDTVFHQKYPYMFSLRQETPKYEILNLTDSTATLNTSLSENQCRLGFVIFAQCTDQSFMNNMWYWE